MRKVVIAFAMFVMPFLAKANTDSEIEHLLKFVAQTSCIYERNGNEHSGSEAVEHIRKKYDYYKDDISSTEDFIALAATKSALSGKQYLVHCPDQPTMQGGQWLFDELQRFRASS